MNSKKNKSLSQSFTILKGELQLNFSIWLIQIIITGSVMLFLLIIGLSVNATSTNSNNNSFVNDIFSTFGNVGANIFLFGFTAFLLFTSSIFSIIYIAKSLSYLYNKRKLDMYGSMPITRRCFFNSKVFSAFVMSVMVYIPFAVLSVLIGFLMGADFNNGLVKALVLFGFSVLFYTALYALCAVCSKSTLNALISLFIIESFIPMAASMMKHFFKGFFPGINHYLMPNKFIANIFSLIPDDNSEFVYIIIWVVLSALFMLICNLFIKKRNAENTRRMFVMPLLEYAIKIVLSFVAGLFIGLIVGALTVNSGFVGFVMGFLVASIPTYIVIHVIYNKGFTNLLKSSIALGVLIVVSIGLFWVCDANPMMFNTVPNKEDIASVGFIDSKTPMTDINAELILNSTSDFTDEKDINKILSIHKEAADVQESYETWTKCAMSLVNMLQGTFEDAIGHELFGSGGFIITYKYKNGLVGSYYYPNATQHVDDDEYNFYTDHDYALYDNEKVADTLAEIEISEQYREKYRPLFTNPDAIESCELSYDVHGYESYYLADYNSKEFLEYSQKLREALITDLKNDKNLFENNKPFLPSIEYDDYYYDYDDSDYFYFDEDDYAQLSYNTAENQIQTLANSNDKDHDFPLVLTFSFNSALFYIDDMYYVPESYTNTIKVLKEIGALNADSSINIDNYNYYDYD